MTLYESAQAMVWALRAAPKGSLPKDVAKAGRALVKAVGEYVAIQTAKSAHRGDNVGGRPTHTDQRLRVAELLAEDLTATEIRRRTGAGFALIRAVRSEIEAATHNDNVVRACLDDIDERLRGAE